MVLVHGQLAVVLMKFSPSRLGADPFGKENAELILQLSMLSVLGASTLAWGQCNM